MWIKIAFAMAQMSYFLFYPEFFLINISEIVY